MVQENRRAERIEIKLPVTVQLLDNKTGNVLAGPVQAEARNFSPMGLALSLANIKIDDFHLFFTCQDNPSHILKIDFTLADDLQTIISVPSRPIWYDRDKQSQDDKRALLGVEFLLKPRDKVIKRLAKALPAAGKAPISWWQKKIF
jgi:hypothetical protein